MNRLKQISQWLALFLGVFLTAATLIVEAADVRVTEASAEWVPGEGLKVRGRFDFDLSPRLEDLLKKGIPLYFVTEFDLKRVRRYWWDEHIVTARYEWRLSFHALTRRYRLSRQNLHYSFASLREALAIVRTTRNWTAAEKVDFTKTGGYEASIRLRLDDSKLPKLLQVSPMTTVDWQLDSGWQPCPLEKEEI